MLQSVRAREIELQQRFIKRKKRLLLLQKEVGKELQMQNKLFVKHCPLSEVVDVSATDVHVPMKRPKLDNSPVNKWWEKRHPEVSIYISSSSFCLLSKLYGPITLARMPFRLFS